jgi:hypothetical protein
MRRIEPMIEFVKDAATGLIEIVVRGDVTDADLQAVSRFLADEKRAGGRIYVLETIESVGEVEPSLVWEGFKRLIVHGEPAGKAAVVTDRKWKTWFNEVLVPFVGTDIRVFERHEADQARAWLMGETESGQPLGHADADASE